jgi:hypothetical protein
MDAHSQNYGILAQNEKTVPKIHTPILFKIHNIYVYAQHRYIAMIYMLALLYICLCSALAT